MKISIRPEQPEDFREVFDLVRKAFEHMEHSDGDEPYLVDRLRQSDSYIPELALVAEWEGNLVGHILFTSLYIRSESHRFDTLSLAPVSVLPKFHGKGVGSQLIEMGHEIAKKLGHRSVVLIGHENYYPRFGYKRADLFNIQFPFEAPPENCMVVELVDHALEGVNGKVEYPKEFFNS